MGLFSSVLQLLIGHTWYHRGPWTVDRLRWIKPGLWAQPSHSLLQPPHGRKVPLYKVLLQLTCVANYLSNICSECTHCMTVMNPYQRRVIIKYLYFRCLFIFIHETYCLYIKQIIHYAMKSHTWLCHVSVSSESNNGGCCIKAEVCALNIHNEQDLFLQPYHKCSYIFVSFVISPTWHFMR